MGGDAGEKIDKLFDNIEIAGAVMEWSVGKCVSYPRSCTD